MLNVLETLGNINIDELNAARYVSAVETVQFIPPKERKRVLEAVQEDHLPVLILGENGSGKGAIARYIHRYGPRAARPLTEWSLPNTLAQALIETQGGSLVIESLNKLSSEDQKTLERFLSQKTVVSPESGLPTLIKARLMILSDPKKDPELGSASPLLKKAYLSIQMPNLKDRKEEFEDIAQQLLFEYTHQLHKEHIRGIHYLAMAKLKNYPWPGNLRELRNVLSLAVINATGNQVQIENLPLFGENHPEMRTSRGDFRRIYFQELFKVYNGNLKRISEVTQTSIESIQINLTTPRDSELPTQGDQKVPLLKTVPENFALSELELL